MIFDSMGRDSHGGDRGCIRGMFSEIKWNRHTNLLNWDHQGGVHSKDLEERTALPGLG